MNARLRRMAYREQERPRPSAPAAEPTHPDPDNEASSRMTSRRRADEGAGDSSERGRPL